MSVGIIQVPNLFTPAYNMMACVASGTNSLSGNYQLMVKIRNSISEVLAKLKAPTDLTYTTQSAFDVHRILETYVGHTLDIDLSETTMAVNNSMAYTLEFGEEYGSPTPIEYWSGSPTSTKYALNIALSPRAWNAWDYLDYYVNGTSRMFLNSFKGTRRIFSTTKAFLYYLWNDVYIVNNYKVACYDVDGGQIGSTASIIADPLSTSPVAYFCSGAVNLNALAQVQIVSGTAGSIVPANTSYYDVWLDYNGTQVSEKLRYSIIENCSMYQNYVIYFLGQMGQMEVFNFSKKSYVNNTIARETYKTPLGRFLSQSSYGYSDSDRQLTTFNTEVKEDVTVNTDLLTEAELTWLKECVQSPVVYSLEGGVLIPIQIIDSNFIQKKKVNEKVFNLTMTFQYSSSLELQRG